jgi:hypothetical protein
MFFSVPGSLWRKREICGSPLLDRNGPTHDPPVKVLELVSRSWKRVWVVGAAVAGLGVPVAHADDKGVAQTAFMEGRRLVKEGKLAEACPKFEASFKAEPALGTLLTLADCHEKTGRTATAWVEFSEAREMAARHGDDRATAAAQRATALEAKLIKLVVKPAATAVRGLVVMRDDSDITELLGVPTPIDPGEHEIRVSAPGYVTAVVKVTATALGATIDAQVPVLVKTPAAPPTEPAAAAKAPTPAHQDKAQLQAKRTKLFREWTPPKAEAHEQRAVRLAIKARIEALYGRCDAARLLADKVQGLDAAYYAAVIEPDPLMALCAE